MAKELTDNAGALVADIQKAMIAGPGFGVLKTVPGSSNAPSSLPLPSKYNVKLVVLS